MISNLYTKDKALDWAYAILNYICEGIMSKNLIDRISDNASMVRELHEIESALKTIDDILLSKLSEIDVKIIDESILTIIDIAATVSYINAFSN